MDSLFWTFDLQVYISIHDLILWNSEILAAYLMAVYPMQKYPLLYTAGSAVCSYATACLGQSFSCPFYLPNICSLPLANLHKIYCLKIPK